MNFRTLLAPVLLLALSSQVALAFELFPEFENLSEQEQTRFEKPEAIGAEYQSDFLTYMLPKDWQYSWLSHPRAAEFSAGSVSPVHFLISNRVKIHHELSKYLEVRFTYYADRTRERDSTHALLEMVAWPSKKIGVGIYAEPSLYKRDNDVGVALLYRPQGTANHEIRLFQTWVDLTRNKRSDMTDRFNKDKLPYARGLVGRWWRPLAMGPKDYIEYAIRQETLTSWEFPDQNYVYDYSGALVSLTVSRELKSERRLDLRAQVDRKFENKTGTVSESWRTDRALIDSNLKFSGLGPGRTYTFTPGLMFAVRQWHSRQAELMQRHLLPHFWIHAPAFRTFGGDPDAVGLGYELTWYLQSGAGSLDPLHSNGGATEHRINLSYDLKINPEATFRLLATFDGDSLGTGDTWEGGAAQLHFVF